MYKLRHLEGELRRMAKLFKIILVLGARQVGKTTILKETFPDAKIVTFDPDQDIFQARKDPDFFFESQPKQLILDEIQYASELLPALKRVVDRSSEYGQYFLTGSHNLNVLRNVSESLAGRVGILNLAPMTTYEQTDSFTFNHDEIQTPPLWLKLYLEDPKALPEHIEGTTNQPVSAAIFRGGMPATLTFPDETIGRYFASYFQTYIQRDIRTFANIQDITSFHQFVRIVAALTGQEINGSHIGREADIDPRTAREWLRLLQHGYQWQEVLPFSRNSIKKVVSTKTKGYMRDTGMACFLLGIPSPDAVLSHPNRGALFETLVINTIISMLHALGDRATIFYWRTRNEAEVDVVLEYNGALYPIEIKMKVALASKDCSGLRSFRESYSGQMTVKTALIIYVGTECYWFDRDTIALPWNAVCRK